MVATSDAVIQQLSPAQATDLSQLVDLEARWENLRIYQPAPGGNTSTLKELSQKQKAYEAFFSKLATYNKGYKPPHVPEQMLNNAPRLRTWCRRMRELILRVQHDPEAHYPIHVMAKAYRWADRLADRLKKDPIARPAASVEFAAAVKELEDLAQWCDGLSQAAA